MTNPEYNELKKICQYTMIEVCLLKRQLISKGIIKEATPDDYGNAMNECLAEMKAKNDELFMRLKDQRRR
jgi:hypothetical protein